MAKSPRLVHVISGLGVGGAEHQLLQLVQRTVGKCDYRYSVICLTQKSDLRVEFEALGVDVVIFDLKKLGLIRGLKALVLYFNDPSIKTVQSWMYHADFMCALIKIFSRNNFSLYWNVRHTEVFKPGVSLSAKICFVANIILSHIFPRKIVCCSNDVASYVKNKGFKSSKLFVIENIARDFFQLNINRDFFPRMKSVTTFLLVGRFNDQKNHELLFQTLEHFNFSDRQFSVFVVSPDFEKLTKVTQARALTHLVHVFSPAAISQGVFNLANSILMISKYGEGFPNTLAEGLLCGLYPIVTDSGCSLDLVADSPHCLISSCDSAQLGSAMFEVIDLAEKNQIDRMSIRSIARKRLGDGEDKVDSYLEIWHGC